MIRADKCVGCGACIPYCPVGAILDAGEMVIVVQDECVECEVCLRSGICPADAFELPPLQWPRSLRNVFSNPLLTHQDTNVPGRGTEEMKTNDVTGRFRRGMVGLAVELGRPGKGARFWDVEKVAMALARCGVHFCPENPVTSLMVDAESGKLREDVLGERVLSAIVECDFPVEKLEEVLTALSSVAKEVATVFSVDFIARAEEDGSVPLEGKLIELGVELAPAGKTNVGLGRPLAKA